MKILYNNLSRQLIHLNRVFMKTQHRLLFALLLLLVAVFGRLGLQELNIPNIEPLTLTILLAGVYLGGNYAIAIAILSIGITDVVIGNDIIFIFTWSAWMIIAVFGLVFYGRNMSLTQRTLGITGMGILANLFFYAWTNFGVWAVGNLYPLTWDGLVACYVAGLPFLKLQVLGNLVMIPVATVLFNGLAETFLQSSRRHEHEAVPTVIK